MIARYKQLVTRRSARYKQLVTRRSARVAESMNIRPRTYRQLRRIGAPLLLFQILHFIFTVAPGKYRPESQFVHCCEFYSGIQTIVNEFSRHGLAALPFDYERDSNLENACTPAGWLTMICHVLMMLDGGRSLSSWATVCSSWVYSSRGSCGRSRLIPLGDTHVDSVKAVNLQVARMSATMQLLWSACISWILEQPASSVMSVHPKMRIVYESMGCTWMGLFGAPTPKPTVLRSSHPFVFKLSRKMAKVDRERFAQLKAEAEAEGKGMVREL